MFHRSKSISHYEFSRLNMLDQFLFQNKPVQHDHLRKHLGHTYEMTIPNYNWDKTYADLQRGIQDKIASLDFSISNETPFSQKLQNTLESAIHARAFEFFDALYIHILKNDIVISKDIINHLVTHALHYYSAVEFEELLGCLHVDVNQSLLIENSFSDTPSPTHLSLLHCAVRFKMAPIVALLLNKGADTRALSENGLTPLEEAENAYKQLDPNVPCISPMPQIYQALKDHEEKLTSGSALTL